MCVARGLPCDRARGSAPAPSSWSRRRSSVPQLHFTGFDQFDELVIGVTHSTHALTKEQRQQVQEAFAQFEEEDGVHFEQPIRVDLLRSPHTQA